MVVAAWVPGQKYRIRHQTDAQRKEHESVMTFLGKSDMDATELQFDARPAGGTQTLRLGQVKSKWPVPMAVPHNIDGRE